MGLERVELNETQPFQGKYMRLFAQSQVDKELTMVFITFTLICNHMM